MCSLAVLKMLGFYRTCIGIVYIVSLLPLRYLYWAHLCRDNNTALAAPVIVCVEKADQTVPLQS